MCGVDDIKKIYLFGGTLLIVEKTSKKYNYSLNHLVISMNMIFKKIIGI